MVIGVFECVCTVPPQGAQSQVGHDHAKENQGRKNEVLLIQIPEESFVATWPSEDKKQAAADQHSQPSDQHEKEAPSIVVPPGPKRVEREDGIKNARR
mmetsp:Transcript_6560/g.12398  ORF Transcript_6560/g.12398 Transcript_6560/m.12398 type:complete len:98 (-) Transcript_6560:227-520(-)